MYITPIVIKTTSTNQKKISEEIEKSGMILNRLIKNDIERLIKKYPRVLPLNGEKFSKLQIFENFIARRSYRIDWKEKFIVSNDNKVLIYLRRSTELNTLSLDIISSDKSKLESFVKKLTQKISKVRPKAHIHFSRMSELYKLEILDSLKPVSDTDLLNSISSEAIEYISSKNVRIQLLKLRKSISNVLMPDKGRYLIDYKHLKKLTEYKFFEENYGLYCPICKKITSINTKSMKEAKKSLKCEICSQCASHSNFDNIIPVFKLSKLGNVSIKGGNWLEVFVKHLFIKNGVNPEHIKIHSYKEREFDVVFYFKGFLIACDCKDKKIGINAIDLFIDSIAPKIGPDKTIFVRSFELTKGLKNFIKAKSEEEEIPIKVMDSLSKIDSQIKIFLNNLSKERKIDEENIISYVTESITRYLDNMRISFRSIHNIRRGNVLV